MRNILFSVILLSSSFAFAQSNAVVVVPFGGLQSVPVRTLDLNNQVVSLGNRRVVPNGEDVRISDLKILPDGSHLMADVNGRGFALSDQDGNYRYEFQVPNTISSIKSVSVGSYFSPGQPSILAIADSSSQVALLRDTSSDQVGWGQSLRQGDSQADIVQIVVQPENKISIAANYPTLGLSIVETYRVDEQGQSPKRFSNVALAGQPVDTTIVPGLEQIRELMLLEDGSYLITTHVNLISLSHEGVLLWNISIGDLDNVGGEFSAARKLQSGLIAVTTYEPGEWTRPHFNHRVHWIDPQTQSLVASSAVFSAAPIRVEPLAGHGGTGSFGFEAGLNEIGEGDFSEVSVKQLNLAPIEVEVGDRLGFAVTLLNTDTFSVALKNVNLKAAPGTCPVQGDSRVLGNATSIALGPDATYVLNSDILIDNTFELGTWCAVVEIENAFGQKRTLEKNLEFSILTRKSESSSTVEIDELPFREGPVDFGNMDVGNDAADLGTGVTPISSGCCATTSTRKGPFGLIFLIVSFLVFFQRRK